jgi:hypothetical protein
MKNKQISDWKLMGNFLNKRSLEPWKSPSYVFYFIIVIVLVGTFGVLKDLIEMEWHWSWNLDNEKVKSFTFNVTNIGLSLVTASVIDLIFITQKTVKNETNEDDYLKIESIKKSIRIFGLCSLIVIFVVWIIVNNFLEHNLIKILLSIFSLLFSYFIWWISNVRNKILQNRFNVFATLGKERTNNFENERPTSSQEETEASLNGNTSNFKTD